MLRELRAFPLLDGFRGQPPGDVAAAATAVERLAAVAIALGPRLEALEVNPLIVHPRGAGATAVDALLLLGAAP
jgi:succinyl-CoA synthetase beta subunit